MHYKTTNIHLKGISTYSFTPSLLTPYIKLSINPVALDISYHVTAIDFRALFCRNLD